MEQSRVGLKFVHRPSTIFVGGGTPTYLSPQLLETLCQKIATHFDTAGVSEFTFESDPSSITNDKIKVLKQFRVNWISIGIQTFSDRINRINERGHTRAQSMRAIECVRNAGINNINLDIICGLAGDTLETFRETITQIRAIKPEHLTMYLFSFRPQTVAFSKIQNDRIPLPPDESQRIAMYKHARNELLELGYVQTTPNCFVLAPEFEQVHQRNAWNSYPLLGFGNSAYSFYGDAVAQNVRASRAYNLCIESNENPTRLFYKLSSRDLMARYIVLRLKLHRSSMRFRRKRLASLQPCSQ